VRAHYDAVFEELASSTQLEDAAVTHQEIERRRSIRAYPPSSFGAAKLREAVKLETEAGNRPTLILLEGVELDATPADEVADVRALAQELEAEVWLSAAAPGEQIESLPPSLSAVEELVSVILALEPHVGEGAVRLRALKDHDSTDLSALRVALDPRTLLLIRN
jgi:hypothetical protein